MEGEQVEVDSYLWPHRPGPNDRQFDRQTATVVVTEHPLECTDELYRVHFLRFDDGEAVSQFDTVYMECRCADRKQSAKLAVRS
tara:strand:+ start:971 stop:1222 length:252 start_codon:yes stop_codon:yes gene_type:complete